MDAEEVVSIMIVIREEEGWDCHGD